MSGGWPEPPGGWKNVEDIGDVMSDDEIRALGFEPTARGWRPLKPEGVAAEYTSDPAPPSAPEPKQQELLDGIVRDALKRRYG